MVALLLHLSGPSKQIGCRCELIFECFIVYTRVKVRLEAVVEFLVLVVIATVLPTDFDKRADKDNPNQICGK